MTGTVNIYIPRTANGERMTGPVPKGQRAVARRTPTTETRPFFDPEATRNLKGAIRMTDPKHPLNPRNVAKRGPLPRIAPAGWTLAPATPRPTPEVATPAVGPVALERLEPASAEPVEVRQTPAVELRPLCCGKTFRTPNGYAWHMTNAHAHSAPPVAA